MNFCPKKIPLRIPLLVGISALVCFLPMTANPVIRAQTTVPDYPVTHIVMSGDGTRLGVLGRSEPNDAGEIVYFADVLDASTLEIVSSVEIGIAEPRRFDISSNGRYLVYSRPSTAWVADTVSGQKDALFLGGVGGVGDVKWSPTDGRLAYSVGNYVLIVKVYGESLLADVKDENSPGLITAVAWSTDGRNLATTTYFAPPGNVLSGTKNLQIWSEAQITSESIVTSPDARFAGGGGGILIWSPTGEYIANSQSKGIAVLKVDTGQEIILQTPFERGFGSIAWSPDGSQIAGGGLDAIWVWDVSTGQITDTITTDGLVDALVWSPTLGLIHNGKGNGIYLNGTLVNAPLPLPIVQP